MTLLCNGIIISLLWWCYLGNRLFMFLLLLLLFTLLLSVCTCNNTNGNKQVITHGKFLSVLCVLSPSRKHGADLAIRKYMTQKRCHKYFPCSKKSFTRINNMAYVYLSRQRSKPFYSPHFQLFSIEQCIILVWSTTSAPHTSQSTNTNDGD